MSRHRLEKRLVKSSSFGTLHQAQSGYCLAADLS